MSPTFAFVTPSFAPDFDQCRLLAQSIVRYAPPDVQHYILVDRQDERLFTQLRGPRTQIVVKEELLPGWLRPLPLSRKWWLNLKRPLPVRGWVLQQVTKLSVPRLSDADVFIFVDSDTFLIRDYDPVALVKDGRIPMFRELLPVDDDPHNVEWHNVAARVYGVPEQPRHRTNYVTQLVTWRRDNLLRLQSQIERTTGRGWIETVCGCRTVSEYVLYGFFCEHLLQGDAGHYWKDRSDTLTYWGIKSLGEPELRELKATLQPEHFAIMISAKSHTPISAIRNAFELA